MDNLEFKRQVAQLKRELLDRYEAAPPDAPGLRHMIMGTGFLLQAVQAALDNDPHNALAQMNQASNQFGQAQGR